MMTNTNADLREQMLERGAIFIANVVSMDYKDIEALIQDHTTQAVNQLLDRLEGQAVEVTPVMYNRPDKNGVIVGVTNSAVPLTVIQSEREKA